MTELEAYKKIYGELAYCVPHYQPKFGWVKLTYVVNKNIKTCYIDGAKVDEFTFSCWMKVNIPEQGLLGKEKG